MHTWAQQLATENFCGKDTAEYTLIQTFWYWWWKFSDRFCEFAVCVNHTEPDLPSGASLKVFYIWEKCWVWKWNLVPHCQDVQNPCEDDGANRLGPTLDSCWHCLLFPGYGLSDPLEQLIGEQVIISKCDKLWILWCYQAQWNLFTNRQRRKWTDISSDCNRLEEIKENSFICEFI